MGYPSLIFLSPSGEVIGRYRGYKRGEADFLWGQLKHAEAVSAEAYKGWRAGLEKKGYREWQDRKERKIFAKLTSYNKGTLTFIEPDGTRSRTQETSLSDKDRAWIAEQKKTAGHVNVVGDFSPPAFGKNGLKSWTTFQRWKTRSA